MVAFVACCPAVGTSHLPLMPPGLLHEPVGGEMGCGSTRRVLMFDAEPDSFRSGCSCLCTDLCLAMMTSHGTEAPVITKSSRPQGEF